MGCVYVATNRVNGKQYVGMTMKTLGDRMSAHKHHAFVQNFQSKFHNAIRKYGWDAFDWIEVFQSDARDSVCAAEIRWIAHLRTFENGYNMTRGGEGAIDVVISEDGRRRIGEANRKRGSPTQGKHLSAETKAKISNALKGRSNWVGRHHSEESKLKMSESAKRRKRK